MSQNLSHNSTLSCYPRICLNSEETCKLPRYVAPGETRTRNGERDVHLKGKVLSVKGSRQGLGGGPAGEDTVQVAVLGRDAGGTRCWYLHLHRAVLRVRDSGDRVHLRGLAQREERSTTQTRRQRDRSDDGVGAWHPKMAVAAVHGPTSR